MSVIASLCCPSASAQDPDPLVEGLVEFENAKVDVAYMRPGVDWAKYKSIHFYELQVTPEARDATPDSPSSRGRVGESWILRDRDVDAMKEQFARTMARELSKSELELVDEPRADTLIIAPTIVDVYLTAPIEDTRSVGGRNAVYTEYAGALTLSAIMADAETGLIVARAVDQRYPNRSGLWNRNTRVFNISDMNQIFRAWGRMLRKRLPDFASGDVETP